MLPLPVRHPCTVTRPPPSSFPRCCHGKDKKSFALYYPSAPLPPGVWPPLPGVGGGGLARPAQGTSVPLFRAAVRGPRPRGRGDKTELRIPGQMRGNPSATPSHFSSAREVGCPASAWGQRLSPDLARSQTLLGLRQHPPQDVP